MMKSKLDPTKKSHPFRMKDKNTGLYYIPNRQVRNVNGVVVTVGRLPSSPTYIKSNLSKTGKVYLSWPWGSFDSTSKISSHIDIGRPITLDDFEVEYL